MRQVQVQRIKFSDCRPRSVPSPYALCALLAIIIVWTAHALAYSQGTVTVRDKASTFEPVDSSIVRQLRLVATLLFAGAGAVAAFMRTLKIPAYAVIALVIMEVACAFWCFLTYDVSGYANMAVSNTSPFIMIMCLGIFLAADNSLWPWLERVSLWLAYASALLGVYCIEKYPLSGNPTGLFPPTMFLQVAFWFGTFSLYQVPRHRIGMQVVASIPILLSIVEGIYVQNRSWPIQCVLVILVRFVVLNSYGGAPQLPPDAQEWAESELRCIAPSW